MSNNYGPKIVTDGLVLCLDAANRRSYPGSGNSWLDLSGNGNNGTFGPGTAAPTFSSGNGGSLVFDGSNDYVNVATATSLGINSSLTSFSINIWFTTMGAGEYYLFDNWNGGVDISLRVDNGKFESYLAATGSNLLLCGFGYNNGVWQNFNLTWNGSNIVNAYANGVGIGSNTSSITGSFESNAPFRIGHRPAGGGAFFPGKIAQLSIYNRALSADEVRSNYLATKSRFGL